MDERRRRGRNVVTTSEGQVATVAPDGEEAGMDDHERRQDRGADDGEPIVQRTESRGDTAPESRAPASEAQVAQARASVARQREAFGGMHLGTAFFGFLTAAGVAVLLAALAVAGGAAVGVGVETEVDPEDVTTMGVWGAVVVGVLVFVAYYCGGYVAGRMSRFDGVKQGFAVWLWALVVATVVAVVSAFAGAEYNLFAEVNLFPRFPVDEGDLTTAGIAAAAGAVVLALVGAVIGGLVGVRFHRKVDLAGVGA